MGWDTFLLSILVYNIVRSARRGGSVVCFELASFFVAYAATFTFAPGLTVLLREMMTVPPLLLPFFSILAIYFIVSRSTRILLLFIFPTLPVEPDSPYQSSPRSRASLGFGAGMGVLRGAIVVAGIAMIGCSFARLQDLGYASGLPSARESIAIQHADGLIGLVLKRYTRSAGPTTQQLVALSHHPSRKELDALLAGPFVARLKRSDVVKSFAMNQEVRSLVESRRIFEVMIHPTFVAVVSHIMRELQLEPSVAPVAGSVVRS